MLRLGPPLSPRLSLLPACAAREQPSGSQAHVQGNLRNPLTPALHASSDAHRVHARLPPRRFNLAHHPLPSVAHARRAPAPHRRLLLLPAHVRLKGIEAHLLCNALDERPRTHLRRVLCARDARPPTLQHAPPLVAQLEAKDAPPERLGREAPITTPLGALASQRAPRVQAVRAPQSLERVLVGELAQLRLAQRGEEACAPMPHTPAP